MAEKKTTQKADDKVGTPDLSALTEGEVTTSGKPPVDDPRRKQEKSEPGQLGYNPAPASGVSRPGANEVEEPEDRRFTPATKARWANASTADLAAEQREIRENTAKKAKSGK